MATRTVMTNFTAGGSSSRNRGGGVPEESNELPTGTIKEVLDWVGNDLSRAQEAYNAELERDEDDQRKGVYEELERNFPLGTIEQALEWVGDDKERASQALEMENATAEPRVSLVEKLERLSADDEAEANAEQSSDDTDKA